MENFQKNYYCVNILINNINKTHVYGNYTKHTFNKLKPQMEAKY